MEMKYKAIQWRLLGSSQENNFKVDFECNRKPDFLRLSCRPQNRHTKVCEYKTRKSSLSFDDLSIGILTTIYHPSNPYSREWPTPGPYLNEGLWIHPDASSMCVDTGVLCSKCRFRDSDYHHHLRGFRHRGCYASLQSFIDRKSTRLNSSHSGESRMPSSA